MLALPRWRDVTDPWGVLKYNLGLAPVKPAFGRFSYIEKTEYWAMAWGTLTANSWGGAYWQACRQAPQLWHRLAM